MPPLPVDPVIAAGLSVTAAVTATAIIDRAFKRNEPKPRANKLTEAHRIRKPQVSASQEAPFVIGNMLLATNL